MEASQPKAQIRRDHIGQNSNCQHRIAVPQDKAGDSGAVLIRKCCSTCRAGLYCALNRLGDFLWCRRSSLLSLRYSFPFFPHLWGPIHGLHGLRRFWCFGWCCRRRCSTSVHIIIMIIGTADFFCFCLLTLQSSLPNFTQNCSDAPS